MGATRAWLNKKGFPDVFTGWEADALLGSDKSDIIATVPGVEGLKLWGLLNTARQTAGWGLFFAIEFYLMFLIFESNFLHFF